MSSRITPVRAAVALAVLLLATGTILYSVPSGDYILLPDVAHPVAPLVHVQGAKNPGNAGHIYFVDVIERRASELEALFPWLHSHATLVPSSEIVPPGSTSQQLQNAELQEMATSQRVAAAVALRRLGYHVVVKANGVLIDFVDPKTHAIGKLQPDDVIVAVDGTPTPTLTSLHRALDGVKPGRVVSLRVQRGSHALTVPVETVPDPSEPARAFIGIEVAQASRVELPLRVSIDAGEIGGPSAGLAFALEVMERLGRNVTHGYRVAATGEMELDGSVAPIGGVEQKTYGAREAGADVFLVPAGGNARTARRYAGPLRIIPVRTFAQALHALATLPPKG